MGTQERDEWPGNAQQKRAAENGSPSKTVSTELGPGNCRWTELERNVVVRIRKIGLGVVVK